MTCLRADQMYAFLEGELSAAEAEKTRLHLRACAGCRRAVEDRRRLVEASSGLPDLEMPSDIASLVMRRIFPPRPSLRQTLGVATSVLGIAVLTFLAACMIFGQSPAVLFVHVNRIILGLFKDLLVLSAEMAKGTAVGIGVLQKLIRAVGGKMLSLPGWLYPELLIILVALAGIFSALLYLGARKIFVSGAKT
ncbi:MAG: anti-sigma factor family protein [Candidatus Aminicenantales bacterium]